MNCKFKLQICCPDLKGKMGTYGHLLRCPLCHELFTHPVLLPCQHSLCYGCARSQILCDTGDALMDVTSPMMSRKNSDSDLSNCLTSPISRDYTTSSIDSPRSVASPMTSSNDSRFDFDESDCSFVLSTNDCLHFDVEPDSNSKSYSPRANQSLKKFSSPSRGNTPTFAGVTSFTTSLRQPSKILRRSSSTSSIARTATLRHRQQQNYGSLKKSRVKSLFCPTCEKRVELGKLGISGLFRNFALESIVERFRTAAKAAVAIRCGYCKPPAADATKSCIDCKLSYCNECFKIVHVWGTKKARHGYVGPTNNFSRPKVLLCPEHSNEVSMYCNKCKKSVCRMCKLGGGAHVNHSVSSAKSAYREGKERLCSDLAILKTKKEAIDAKIDSLGEAFTALERREAETREQIHASIDGMYRTLEVKRNDLLAKADAQMRQKEHELRQEMQNQHRSLMSASIVSFAEEVMKETEPSFFLQTSRMVELRLKEAIESLSAAENDEVGFEPAPLNLDVSLIKEQLENLDFVQPKTAERVINDVTITSSLKNGDKGAFADFHWITSVKDCDVIIEKRKASVRHSSLIPCVLKGSVAFENGEHYWEVIVTSYAAHRIIIGVCNMFTDEKLHGSINCHSGGAFLIVSPGSASVVDEAMIGETLPFLATNGHQAAGNDSEELPIGKHVFDVGIHLKIIREDAIVHFYDVTSDPECKNRKLFQKTFKFRPPVHPVVAVSGNATVRLA